MVNSVIVSLYCPWTENGAASEPTSPGMPTARNSYGLEIVTLESQPGIWRVSPYTTKRLGRKEDGRCRESRSLWVCG